MKFTGERFIPGLDGEIRYSHMHRYALAYPLVAGKDVLDIASGEGYGAALMAHAARSVTGVDIDPESIKHARETYESCGNLEFMVGACESIPLSNQSVDVVASFETIEHHDKHQEMMR